MSARIWLATLCALLALAPASGRADSETRDLKLVRLTFGYGWDALPALAALERGFFAAEGLLVSGMAIGSAQAVMNSLSTGTTDIAVVPQRTLLVMAAAKLPVTVVGMSGWGTRFALLVRRDLKDVKTLADLKGRTIAVGQGAEEHPALMRLLNANGLGPSDVEIRMLTAEPLSKTFEDPEIDAICASGHYTDRILEKGDARYLATHEQIVESIGYLGATPLVVSNELLDANPGTVQRIVTAWIKALRHLESDPDDAMKILQIFFHRQGVSVPDEQARAWVKMTRYDRYLWSDADVSDAEYNGWGLVEGGILKVQPELDHFVDNRFAQTALREIEKATAASSAEAGSVEAESTEADSSEARP